ncbi:MAG: DoxX family membrane protein, partial [Rhodobacteraceae bacterium]|nr:DoxX family membrane protein [Paracoccaceae bacterium]
MNRLITLHNAIFDEIEKADGVIPLLARFVFAATLLNYFWVSALTKTGDGVLGLFKVTAGGFGQIFPKQAESVLWDVSQMSVFQKVVVLAGTWAEFILPVLIVVGFATRLASIGMIGFVVVQSLTDLYGHGGIAHGETLGAFRAEVSVRRAVLLLKVRARREQIPPTIVTASTLYT